VRRAWRSGRVTCSSLRTTVFSHRPRSTRRDRRKGNPIGALSSKSSLPGTTEKRTAPASGGRGLLFPRQSACSETRRTARVGVCAENGVVEPGNLPELGRQPSSAFDQSFAAELVTRRFAAAATAGRCKA
jgi:hypothetical protein